MKERPILYKAPMVRAILDGSKTITRRLSGLESVNINPDARIGAVNTHENIWDFVMHDGGTQVGIKCPFGKVGDQHWVKETWRTWASLDNFKPSNLGDGAAIEYAAGGKSIDPANLFGVSKKWRSPLFMQKRFSRIQLEITGIRVERLQDISEADAKAEGAKPFEWACAPGYEEYTREYREGYRKLWESINCAGSWNANPWVWVVEFRRIKP